MQDTQDLNDILSELPDRFVHLLEDATSIKDLKKLKQKHRCYNRTAAIDARIENLKHNRTA